MVVAAVTPRSRSTSELSEVDGPYSSGGCSAAGSADRDGHGRSMPAARARLRVRQASAPQTTTTSAWPAWMARAASMTMDPARFPPMRDSRNWRGAAPSSSATSRPTLGYRQES